MALKANTAGKASARFIRRLPFGLRTAAAVMRMGTIVARRMATRQRLLPAGPDYMRQPCRLAYSTIFGYSSALCAAIAAGINHKTLRNNTFLPPRRPPLGASPL